MIENRAFREVIAAYYRWQMVSMTTERLFVKVRSHSRHDISDLQQRLLRLADIVDRAIIAALWALAHHNAHEAKRIIAGDQAIDDLRDDIQRYVITLLGCQQPTARDLRFVTETMMVAAELERIGDHASGIAEIVVLSAVLPPQELPPEINQMAYKARELLQETIRSVVQRDASAVNRLRRIEQSVDQTYQQLIDQVHDTVSNQPEQGEWVTYLLWVGHNLKGIAAQAISIAERAAFIATGTAIGHHRHTIPVTQTL
jgi:phosphate transport system protein